VERLIPIDDERMGLKPPQCFQRDLVFDLSLPRFGRRS
jgi:hypothetical protein